MIWTIFKPFNYLMIQAETGGKFMVDICVPFIFSLIITGFLLFLNIKIGINIYDGTHKITSNIIGFVQTLPGFYIAALAAIISFPNRSLDNRLNNPRMFIKREHDDNDDNLTRRRLLCYLLAYLAFIGILICLLIIFVEFCYSFSLGINQYIIMIGYCLISLILFFLLSQLVLLTFNCLWYLGERIHFNDPD